MNEALLKLYPDGKIDRTNTRIISKPSPCLTDVAIYLTGGRYQFNTFFVSSEIEGLYIVQRIDNGKTFLVSRKPNVKPSIIDEMGKKAIQQQLSACDIDLLKKYEDNYSDFLIKQNVNSLFEINELNNFEWKPILLNNFIKTDVLNKNLIECK